MQRKWTVILVAAIVMNTFLFPYSVQALKPISLPPEVQIVIDPGHGGIDSGATYENIEEKQINLAVATEIYHALSRKGYRVIMTRERDEALSDSSRRKDIASRHQRDLVQRREIIRTFAPQIVLSIHVNAGSSKNQGGLVLYQKSGQGYILAHLIQRNLNKVTNTRGQPIVNRDLFILNQSNTIALVIELGFISNPQDRNRLIQPEYQKQLAHAIVSAVDEFMISFPFHLR